MQRYYPLWYNYKLVKVVSSHFFWTAEPLLLMTLLCFLGLSCSEEVTAHLLNHQFVRILAEWKVFHFPSQLSTNFLQSWFCHTTPVIWVIGSWHAWLQITKYLKRLFHFCSQDFLPFTSTVLYTLDRWLCIVLWSF